MLQNLSEDNYILEAAKHYRVPCQDTVEFLSDLKRIKYIKKLFTRFKTNGILDERLVLNHLTILNNVFGTPFLCRLLFLKLLPDMDILKPFLIYLNLLSNTTPSVVRMVNNFNYDVLSIEINPAIVKKLQDLDLHK